MGGTVGFFFKKASDSGVGMVDGVWYNGEEEDAKVPGPSREQLVLAVRGGCLRISGGPTAQLGRGCSDGATSGLCTASAFRGCQ